MIATVNILLKVIWLVCGGFTLVLGYALGSLLLCLTIIGIPFGIQCFKLAGLALAPLGREIREMESPAVASPWSRTSFGSSCPDSNWPWPWPTSCWHCSSQSPSSVCRSRPST
jgi:uncharacterized membrane protein YccF (DUF307 family)